MMLLITLSMCSGIINARQEKDCKFDELINTLPGFWIRHMAKFLRGHYVRLFIVRYSNIVRYLVY